jgi:hypothetical protein
MNEIRRFIESQSALKNPPQYYVLAQDDGSVLVTASHDDAPAEQIERVLKADLAFVTGGVNYALMAQDSAGGISARIKLRQHGTGPKNVTSEASSVNANLVSLVGRLTASTADHFEALYKRQDMVIDALLGSNKSLSASLVEALSDERPAASSPAVAMAEQRLGRLVEVGLGAAVARLTSGGSPEKEAKTAVSIGGKHSSLRELVASSLSDDEIDAIITIALSAGCADQIMNSLTAENLARALEIMKA